MTQFERMQEYAKEKTVLELKQLKKEIKKVVKEETQYDTKWSSGLRYSLGIIDNRISELTGKPKTRKDYNHEYYLKVIKPKRQQKRGDKSGS